MTAVWTILLFHTMLYTLTGWRFGHFFEDILIYLLVFSSWPDNTIHISLKASTPAWMVNVLYITNWNRQFRIQKKVMEPLHWLSVSYFDKEESNLQEELSIAAGLVDIYKHRGFKFELRNDSSEDLSNIAFPTLGLLPLIENAVQHSSAAEGAEKVIATSIRSSPNRITIDIKNPVKNTPVSTSGHKSVGLENCRERISIWTQQYEDECTLDLKVKEGRAEVSLDIPIIHFDE